MDISNPLRSLAPTVEGDVLAVLVRSQMPLTGRRIHELAGRSYSQVREVLHRLEVHGLVDAEDHGAAVAYSFNREHVLATAVETASAAGGEVERRLRAAFEGWTPPPAAVVLFGSFARRDGGPESDVDVLLIRPNDIADGDDLWTAQRYDLVRNVERWTGNSTQIIELTSSELHRAIERTDDLIAAVRRDGRVLVGPTLRSLLAGR